MTEKDKSSAGYTVLQTVDITDRPISNSDPDQKENWAYEQESYFDKPENSKSKGKGY